MTFPARVWEKQPNGLWSSREATAHDRDRRRVLDKILAGEPLTEWDMAIAEFHGLVEAVT